jgi:hypothetical protein
MPVGPGCRCEKSRRRGVGATSRSDSVRRGMIVGREALDVVEQAMAADRMLEVWGEVGVLGYVAVELLVCVRQGVCDVVLVASQRWNSLVSRGHRKFSHGCRLRSAALKRCTRELHDVWSVKCDQEVAVGAVDLPEEVRRARGPPAEMDLGDGVAGQRPDEGDLVLDIRGSELAGFTVTGLDPQ